jgi:hypothetical protein
MAIRAHRESLKYGQKATDPRGKQQPTIFSRSRIFLPTGRDALDVGACAVSDGRNVLMGELNVGGVAHAPD